MEQIKQEQGQVPIPPFNIYWDYIVTQKRQHFQPDVGVIYRSEAGAWYNQAI